MKYLKYQTNMPQSEINYQNWLIERIKELTKIGVYNPKIAIVKRNDQGVIVLD